ncbi:uncharacterized protein TRUGW13939_07923 [Talaromyces rugulosus]|uniref:Uncharacterized protein n=1 Tax=Talaromyces rugulosus TaxID=121627 RepID=A0A7H8R3E1_TALRU|nr:uncharacterized protein TRUGW13939_07923 [Talaromyces rugulosus]QKX60777.1 hypothetical protein TRUGW13939_07923 [Talaromyces rugulosus]
MQYSKKQYMKLLIVKVLQPIQDKLQKYLEKPQTYKDTVQFLQKLEDAMPERQKTRNSQQRDGHSSSGNEYQAAPNHHRTKARPPIDKHKKDDQFPQRDKAATGRSSGGNPKKKEHRKPKGDQTKSTCNYCGKECLEEAKEA